MFEVVSQLTRGIVLVTDPAERESIRRLDVVAGRRARSSAAYASARAFLDIAASLLAHDAWSTRFEEAFALHLDLAECEYLAGDFQCADELLEALLARAGSDLDRARVHLLRIALYQRSGRLGDAWQSAQESLLPFGVSFPESEQEIAAAFDAEQRAIAAALVGRRIADLVDAPAMTSPGLRMAVRLLIRAGVTAYNLRPQCFGLLAAFATRLSILHGSTEDSTPAYCTYAKVLVPLGDIAGAIEFYEAARRLAERTGDAGARAMACASLGLFIHHWRNPIATCVPVLDEGIRLNQELGDLANAAIYALITAWVVIFETGEPLDEALEASEKYLALAVESRNDIARDTIRLIRQLVPALKGTTRDPASFDEETFSEAACLATFREAGFGAGLALHRILKQVAAFLYGRYEEALQATEQQASAPGPASAFLYDLTHHLFRALAAAALYPEAAPARQRGLRRILDEELQRHELWARQCPVNFLHRHALLSAEVARVEGRDLDAMRSYERAIRSARENRFVQHEALAYELASRFYRARGYEQFADTYIRQARGCYLRWGADGKVRQLDHLHPQLESSASAPSGTVTTRSENLDMLSVVKASHTISSQVEVEQLAGTLLQVVLEQGGARKGYLVLAREGDLFIEAEARLEGRGVTSRLLHSLDAEGSPLLPGSMLHYTRTTREPAIVEDATTASGPFASDAYFARNRTRSALCLPIVRQDLIGLLYLENDLLAGVFTPDRLMSLSLLAAQAAISMENALHLARERAARAAAEFLSEAGALLSESLDYEDTLGRLSKLCVQSLADWCVLDLVEEGELRRLVGACADPAKEPLLRELRERHPARWDSPHPAARSLRAGEPVWVPAFTDDLLRSMCEDDEHLELIRALGTSSIVVVPLVARGQTLGALSLASGVPGRYSRADLELAKEVAHRAAIAIDNARLHRETQRAVRLRDEFLLVASHELRTPLTPLTLSLKTLQRWERSSQATLPAAISESVELAVRQGSRLNSLVSELLDVSRIESGRLKLDLSEVELGAIVHAAAGRLEPELARARSPLSIRCDGPVVGRWDASRLDQVIAHLLANAIKFGAGKPIEVHLGQAGGRALLSVTDHGMGIDPAHQARIFERFERAVSVRNYGGLGLGLYMGRRIVEAHGGSIRVESQPGSGATFTVELPRAGAEAGPQA